VSVVQCGKDRGIFKKDSGHVVSAEQWKSRKGGIWNVIETGPFYRVTQDGSQNYKHSTL
jgi:hypothetical protein